MAFSTNAHSGRCPTPFLEGDSFPTTGGFVSGRFCSPIAQLGNVSCCLPCPTTQWTYHDGFEQRTEIANWINVAAFVAVMFLLVSYAVLPVKWTHRHYLSICLVIGVVCMELAFIIPLMTKPEQCFNDITPNDMSSNGSCAASGAFLLFGGWAVVFWVFLRALSLHLQICWEVIPGNTYFYASLVSGWGIPAIGLALTMSLTGVSYRFGDVCHVNHKLALQDFWGPLLAFAALALVLQFITLGYCVHIYVKSLVNDGSTTNSSSQVASYSGSVRTASARQAYRRVKRVIELQWRGACIVLLIIGEVAFFAVVFVSMDNSTQVSETLLQKAQPWLLCLFEKGGDKNQCLDLVVGVKTEGVVLAVLIVLAMSGIWCFILFGRLSMFHGWKDLIQRRLMHKNEFVSADARRFSAEPRTYEMLSGTPNPLKINPPDRIYQSPGTETSMSPWTPDMDSKQANYGIARAYVSPVDSYSTPRPPSSGMAKEWDPQMTHAKSTHRRDPSYTKKRDFG